MAAFSVSKYEDLALPFLTLHPLNSLVTANKLVAFVGDLKNGHIIKADLAITDPGKRLTAIRRHLNMGAASPSLPESSRFVLVLEDPKQRSFMVQPFANVVEDTAKGTLMKSVSGAMTPIKRSIRKKPVLDPRIVPDAKWPGMWRIRRPDGTLTDMVSLKPCNANVSLTDLIKG
jgi:hypothetical protein